MIYTPKTRLLIIILTLAPHAIFSMEFVEQLRKELQQELESEGEKGEKALDRFDTAIPRVSAATKDITHKSEEYKKGLEMLLQREQANPLAVDSEGVNLYRRIIDRGPQIRKTYDDFRLLLQLRSLRDALASKLYTERDAPESSLLLDKLKPKLKNLNVKIAKLEVTMEENREASSALHEAIAKYEARKRAAEFETAREIVSLKAPALAKKAAQAVVPQLQAYLQRLKAIDQEMKVITSPVLRPLYINLEDTIKTLHNDLQKVSTLSQIKEQLVFEENGGGLQPYSYFYSPKEISKDIETLRTQILDNEEKAADLQTEIDALKEAENPPIPAQEAVQQLGRKIDKTAPEEGTPLGEPVMEPQRRILPASKQE